MPRSGSSHQGRGQPEQLRFGIEDDYDDSPRPRTPRPKPSSTRQASDFHDSERYQQIAPPPDAVRSAPTPDMPATSPTESSLGGMVFVPTEPMSPGATQAKLQMRRMRDGRLAVLAYRSLDRLVAGCGAHQGWMAAPVEQLTALQPLAGFDVIALDVELPDDMRVDLAGHVEARNGVGR